MSWMGKWPNTFFLTRAFGEGGRSKKKGGWMEKRNKKEKGRVEHFGAGVYSAAAAAGTGQLTFGKSQWFLWDQVLTRLRFFTSIY